MAQILKWVGMSVKCTDKCFENHMKRIDQEIEKIRKIEFIYPKKI